MTYLRSGIFLAPFHAIYNDVGRALGVVLVLLRYASPTLFAFPKTGAWIWLYRLNPLAAIIDNLRLVATTGEHGHGPRLVVRRVHHDNVIGHLDGKTVMRAAPQVKDTGRQLVRRDVDRRRLE
mgnify:CR=1 FL=1